jgi:hypothetical protein
MKFTLTLLLLTLSFQVMAGNQDKANEKCNEYKPPTYKDCKATVVPCWVKWEKVAEYGSWKTCILRKDQNEVDLGNAEAKRNELIASGNYPNGVKVEDDIPCLVVWEEKAKYGKYRVCVKRADDRDVDKDLAEAKKTELLATGLYTDVEVRDGLLSCLVKYVEMDKFGKWKVCANRKESREAAKKQAEDKCTELNNASGIIMKCVVVQGQDCTKNIIDLLGYAWITEYSANWNKIQTFQANEGATSFHYTTCQSKKIQTGENPTSTTIEASNPRPRPNFALSAETTTALINPNVVVVAQSNPQCSVIKTQLETKKAAYILLAEATNCKQWLWREANTPAEKEKYKNEFAAAKDKERDAKDVISGLIGDYADIKECSPKRLQRSDYLAKVHSKGLCTKPMVGGFNSAVNTGKPMQNVNLGNSAEGVSNGAVKPAFNNSNAQESQHSAKPAFIKKTGSR